MSDTKNILRPFESYLDEVAREYSYENFEESSWIENRAIVLEASRRMCEDAFKAQKEICAESSKADVIVFKLLNGKKNAPYAVVNKSSIINAPTPFNNNL